METGKKTVTVRLMDLTANPAPLGLLAFGMTTVLLNLKNAGFIPMNAMILAMGIFYGGLAQVFAGVMEWKKNNTFGTTAFFSYGFFWLSFIGLLVIPKLGWIAAPDPKAIAAYLFMWGLLTTCLFVVTLRLNRALQVVFGTAAILFFLLALGDYTGNIGITLFAGYWGIFCGFSAIYAAIAQLLNEVYGKLVLPM
jgi:succinate-acetate transporter protein